MAWTLRGPPADEDFANVLALPERLVRVANAHSVRSHGSAYRMPAEHGASPLLGEEGACTALACLRGREIALCITAWSRMIW